MVVDGDSCPYPVVGFPPPGVDQDPSARKVLIYLRPGRPGKVRVMLLGLVAGFGKQGFWFLWRRGGLAGSWRGGQGQRET